MKELFILHRKIITTAEKNNKFITVKLKSGNTESGILLETVNSNGDPNTSFLRIEKNPTREQLTFYFIDILDVS